MTLWFFASQRVTVPEAVIHSDCDGGVADGHCLPVINVICNASADGCLFAEAKPTATGDAFLDALADELVKVAKGEGEPVVDSEDGYETFSEIGLKCKVGLPRTIMCA